jgi:hypothetical protein
LPGKYSRIDGLRRGVASKRQGYDGPGREILDDLPGIGLDLVAKIATLANGGHLALEDELARTVPAGLTALLDLSSLAPKRVHRTPPLLTLGCAAIHKYVLLAKQ